MKLHRLSIDRMPGIDRPFELKALGEGLNIVVGPNGIGKSQVCAAVRALLWHERGIVENGLAASATFGHDGEAWSVVRDGSLHAWQLEGIDVMAPVLPGERLEGCFFLGLRRRLCLYLNTTPLNWNKICLTNLWICRYLLNIMMDL
jgi:hypothetical protein